VKLVTRATCFSNGLQHSSIWGCGHVRGAGRACLCVLVTQKNMRLLHETGRERHSTIINSGGTVQYIVQFNPRLTRRVATQPRTGFIHAGVLRVVCGLLFFFFGCCQGRIEPYLIMGITVQPLPVESRRRFATINVLHNYKVPMNFFCYCTVQYIASPLPAARIGSNGIFRQTDSELSEFN
jgi:hypothetical protein